MKTENLILGATVIGGLLLVRSILRGTGLIKSEERPLTWEISKVPIVNSRACKSSYSRDQIRTGVFAKWAKQIYDAKGFINDDEAAVYDIINNKIRTRGDMYLLSQYFSVNYQKDIIQYMRDMFNDSEMAPIIKKINSLPCNK